jgi:hypothetical protein
MARNEIDKIFELGLLLVTVIGAAELQYSSYIFSFSPTNSTLTQQQIQEAMHSNIILVNSIYRWTTIPVFILVLVWIIAQIVPNIKVNSTVNKFVKRRFIKEFCWCLFGSFFIFEIITFVGISYKSVPIVITYIATALAIFLTFYPTWRYRKDDIYEMRNPTRSLQIRTMYEHIFIFFIAYILMMVIWSYSIILPSLLP